MGRQSQHLELAHEEIDENLLPMCRCDSRPQWHSRLLWPGYWARRQTMVRSHPRHNKLEASQFQGNLRGTLLD